MRRIALAVLLAAACVTSPARPDGEKPRGVRAFLADGGVIEHASFDDPEWTRPRMISGRDPPYTQEALAHGVTGTAITRCRIEADGAVRDCRMTKSLPYLDQAILECIMKRRYEPARYRGEAVATEYTFNSVFKVMNGPHPDAETRRAMEYDSMVYEATEAVRAGRFVEAVATFRQAIALAPQAVPARAGLGMALVLAGDTSHDAEAEQLLATAVQAEPRDPQSWLTLGKVRERLGRPRAEIEPAYQRYLDLDPNGESAAEVRRYLTGPASTGR